jgi:hypothetical protein
MYKLLLLKLQRIPSLRNKTKMKNNTANMKVIQMILLILVWSCLVAFVPQKNRSASEGSSTITIGSDVVVKEGDKVNKAISIGGNVKVYGHVRRDAVSVGGSVYLGPDAAVEGNVVSIGGTVEREPGSRVGGEVTIVDATGLKSWLSWLPKQGIAGIKELLQGIGWPSSLGFFLAVLIIVAAMPAGIGFISFQIENNTARTILMGILGSVLIFPIGFFLFISIAGIVIIPVLIILFGCALILGYIAVAQLIGKRITILLNKPGRHILVETIIGFAAFFAIGLIPLAGWFIKGLAMFLGFGGVLSALTAGSRKNQSTVI